MNARDVRFLFKMGLINQELVRKWEERHSRTNQTADVEKSLLRQEGMRAFPKWCLAFTFFISALAPHAYRKSVLPGMAFGALIGSILAWVISRKPFVKDFIRLHKAVFGWECRKSMLYRPVYCLGKDVADLSKIAEEMLIEAGIDLEHILDVRDVDSWQRKQKAKYRNLHETFLAFSLCDEDADIYLPSYRKKEADKSGTAPSSLTPEASLTAEIGENTLLGES